MPESGDGVVVVERRRRLLVAVTLVAAAVAGAGALALASGSGQPSPSPGAAAPTVVASPPTTGVVYVRGGDGVERVDLRTGAVAAADPAVMPAAAASPADVLCDGFDHCDLALVDRDSGRIRLFDTPHGVTITRGTESLVSPDGQRVVAWVHSDVAGADLYLFDALTGRGEPVPGVRPIDSGEVAWSPDGQWLFIASGSVRAYHLGASEPTVLALPHRNYYGVVAAAS